MSLSFHPERVRTFLKELFLKKYSYKNVSEIPVKIKNDVIYIVQEGTEPETLVFNCPCGCKESVYLNLLKDTFPVWTYMTEKRRISVFPSVVRKKGCRSHYWIKKGKVIWAWSKDWYKRWLLYSKIFPHCVEKLQWWISLISLLSMFSAEDKEFK